MRDRAGEASTLSNIGAVYDSLGDHVKALKFFNQALPIERSIGDRAGEAATLSCIGTLYDRVGERFKALAYYNRALPIEHAVGNRMGEATTLGNIGAIRENLGERTKALELFNEALSIQRVTGDRMGEAATLGNVGVLYDHQSDWVKASDFFNRELSIRHSVGDQSGEATALHYLGVANARMGKQTKALEYYSQALRIWQMVGDRKGEAATLSNMGLVYDELGEIAKALGFYTRALPIQRVIRDRRGEALTLLNIGRAYYGLSEQAKAQEFYNLALRIYQALGDRAGEALTLNQIGLVYDDIGQRAKALKYYSQSLTIRHANGDRAGEAAVLSNIGTLYYGIGERAKALQFFSLALPIERAVGFRKGEATTLNNMGFIYSAFDNNKKALEYYYRALPIQHAIGDRAMEAKTLDHVGYSYEELGAKSSAVLFGKQSVNVYQALRADISALDKSLQKTYIGSFAKTYRALADRLASQGRIAEAQQVLDLLKDDEYFRLLRVRAGTRAETLDLTPVEKKWLAEYDKLSEPIGKLGTERAEIERLAPEARTPAQKARLAAIAAESSQAERAFQAFLAGLKDAFAKGGTDTDRLKDVEASQSLSRTLAKLPATAAVYTLVTEDHVRTILCLPDAAAVGQAPAKVTFADLSKKVLAFRQALQDPTKDPRPLGAELYDLLIRPIEPALKGGKTQTLLWSLDSVLRYVPLWALYDRQTGQYLVQKYPSALFTPRTVDRLAEAVAPSTKAVGFGVTQAETVRGIDGSPLEFPALPGVGAELAAVGAAFGTTPKTDAAFTLAALMDALGEMRGHPGILHVATHFRFRPGSDADSFLLLGGSGKLTLETFKEFPAGALNGVDLLVLSACETAVGSTDADGSEFEGFSLLAQEKGAGAVLATLWPVSDDATAALMRSFYRLRKGHPDWTKLHCLAEAQLAMISDGGNVGPTSRTAGAGPKGGADAPPWPTGLPRLSHPYYWAPFVLVGNSR